jgi:hypothetical protein
LGILVMHHWERACSTARSRSALVKGALLLLTNPCLTASFQFCSRMSVMSVFVYCTPEWSINGTSRWHPHRPNISKQVHFI